MQLPRKRRKARGGAAKCPGCDLRVGWFVRKLIFQQVDRIAKRGIEFEALLKTRQVTAK